ncbi:amine acid ABC transporter, permease protein, 3-TM region, His/Glu/Gln/Arg/opine family [Treponema sp. JC4]|uniref:amino acid ABC transporter permease n=1 Tax=Treponema sp. JC4 TaxID=1124982 RepID=UPI00025AFB94|nr:amino acid ABC transporter permease [Treponema sp. JC4]EID85833.1 amine acid ABC transporter, permease protein, 3-TM region, His/Glu/Gln/Arg/opine family [Treponema sp. JC4]
MEGPILDIRFILSTIPEIATKLPVTLFIAISATLLGLLLGIIIALLRFFHIKILSQLSIVFISFVRGTPMVVQLYLVYYGIPIIISAIARSYGKEFDINLLPGTFFAILAFGLNTGAYMSESLRSSLLAVEPGQFEACKSLHYSTWDSLRKVILPQAFIIALPTLTSALLSMIKNTSLAFCIAVVDLMAQARIVGSRSFRFFEVYVAVSFLYWPVCAIFERLLLLLEKQLSRFTKTVF